MLKRKIDIIRLNEIKNCINERTLFKLGWRFNSRTNKCELEDNEKTLDILKIPQIDQPEEKKEIKTETQDVLSHIQKLTKIIEHLANVGKQKGTNVNVQRINEIMLQNRIIYCKTHIFTGDTRFISTRIDQYAGDRFDTLCEKLDILSKKSILS